MLITIIIVTIITIKIILCRVVLRLNLSQEGNNALGVPQIILDKVERRGSTESVTSQASCISILSNVSLNDIASCKQNREECIKLWKEETSCILDMEEEVSNMLKSCEAQRNVNMTIKDGLKSLTSLIWQVMDKHIAATKEDEKFYQSLHWSEEVRQDRKLRSDRCYSIVLRNVVLDVKKRKRSRPELPKG